MYLVIPGLRPSLGRNGFRTFRRPGGLLPRGWWSGPSSWPVLWARGGTGHHRQGRGKGGTTGAWAIGELLKGNCVGVLLRGPPLLEAVQTAYFYTGCIILSWGLPRYHCVGDYYWIRTYGAPRIHIMLGTYCRATGTTGYHV